MEGVFYRVSMSILRSPNADTGLVSQYSDLCTDTEYRMQLVAGRLTGAHLFSSNSGPTLGGMMEPPSVYNTASQPATLDSGTQYMAAITSCFYLTSSDAINLS